MPTALHVISIEIIFENGKLSFYSADLQQLNLLTLVLILHFLPREMSFLTNTALVVLSDGPIMKVNKYCLNDKVINYKLRWLFTEIVFSRFSNTEKIYTSELWKQQAESQF